MNPTSEMKSFLDGVSLSAFIATLAGWLPHIAALATVVWAIYRIHEIRLSIQIKKLELQEAKNRVESR